MYRQPSRLSQNGEARWRKILMLELPNINLFIASYVCVYNFRINMVNITRVDTLPINHKYSLVPINLWQCELFPYIFMKPYVDIDYCLTPLAIQVRLHRLATRLKGSFVWPKYVWREARNRIIPVCFSDVYGIILPWLGGRKAVSFRHTKSMPMKEKEQPNETAQNFEMSTILYVGTYLSVLIKYTYIFLN